MEAFAPGVGVGPKAGRPVQPGAVHRVRWWPRAYFHSGGNEVSTALADSTISLAALA